MSLDEIREGDPAALDRAIQMHWAEIVEYANSLLGDHEDARDVAQEAFLRLWTGRRRWKPGSDARLVLFGIARNLVLKERRRRSIRSASAAAVRAIHAREVVRPDEMAAAEELSAALQDAIERLPPRRREIFLLSRSHGLTYREISEILKVSPQTVANQLSSALTQLRTSLRPFLKGSSHHPGSQD